MSNVRIAASSNDLDESIVPLLAAVEAHDRSTFISRVETIDWATQQPEDLIGAVNLALQLDLAGIAVKLARQGGRLFPTHEGLRQLARVLAPPAVRTSSAPPARGLDASREWLQNEACRHQGRWVAVCRGQFLGEADTLRELLVMMPLDYDRVSTIVAKIT